MAAIICLVAAFCLLFAGDAQAACDLDAATQQQVLAQLETKYFGHSFDSDSDDCRTDRLEKLIFGESTSGALPQRIEKLAAATATEDNTSSQEHNEAQKQNTAAHYSEQKPSNDHGSNHNSQNLETASAMPQFSSDSGSTGTESYPHIAALEKEILGQSFPSQSLTERLKRMEIKAFGNASDNPDLSERTDTLDQYVEQKLHKPTFTTETAVKEANLPTSPQPDQEQTDYPHITALEKDILGQTFNDQPPADRLSRMETKAFGKPSKSTDLSQRTDALDKYVEKKLHKKPFEEERSETATTNQQQPQQQSRLPAQVLSMVANSLLGSLGGMGGMGFGGLGPSMMPGMFGAGGMPAGGNSGTGFSGTGIHRNNQSTQQQPQPPQAEEPHEDPVMYAATPPPASARTLVKVGWCEVHVFGHTFPHMHLPERLGQLNIELQFKPGTSDMDLLDDIGPMIKVVQARLAAAPKE